MLNAVLLFTLAIQDQSRCSSEFFQNAWTLLKDARYGGTEFERAAFAVRDDDGRVRFLSWPVSAEALVAKYKGSMPPNLFAIVHTHPNRHPAPSADDHAVARRLGIPVYVVTRIGLSFTKGERTEYIALGDWNPERCPPP